MIDDRTSADDPLASLRAAPDDASIETFDADGKRDLAVARIAATIRRAADERARARRRARWLVAGGSAAAVAAAVALFIRQGATAQPSVASATGAERARVRVVAGSVETVHLGASRRLDPSITRELATGDRLVTGDDAGAELVLASGATITLGPRTTLTLPSDDASIAERVTLASGRADFSVPKLGPARSFGVLTPDAEIVVHGTKFHVETSDVGATHVSVTEGLVGVVPMRAGAGETLVHPGERWDDAVEPAPPTATAPALVDRPEPAAGAPGIAAAARPAHPEPRGVDAAPRASDLGEQNRLLGAAMAARRAGDDARALRSLDELLARFPASPLAQEAHVERFRALQRLGDSTSAAREARRYLATHRDGFARDEARGVALDPAAKR